MVNGYTAVALTKLDILDELDEIQIGVKYLKNGQIMEHFPSCEQVIYFLRSIFDREYSSAVLDFKKLLFLL